MDTAGLRAELARLAARRPALPLARVLVALSGGRDSVALLHLALGTGLTVAAAHLDHGTRDGSVDDADFVVQLCAGLGVPLELERVSVPAVAARRGEGLEAAGRRVRYDFLGRAANRQGAGAILTAHTLEDNAETVLFQLLRGTGRATGIPPRRGRVLRPLLGVPRAEFEAYLTERGLAWREDPSNADGRFTRNWLRREVLPLLGSRFPGARPALARYAALSRDEDELLESLAAAVPPYADWRREPLAVQRRLVRRALEAAGVPPDAEHIEALREGLSVGAVRRVSLPGGSTGVVQDGRLTVYRAPVKAELRWPPGLDVSSFPGAELRTRQPGDRIQLPGGTRKLSDVLIDRHVPREERDRVPLVTVGQEVLWVGLEPPVHSVQLGPTPDPHAAAMGEALALAREAGLGGEVPVGAVVTRDGEVIGRGRNRSRTGGDMTLHAELEALREAAQALGTSYLSGCDLVVTLEPCPMCLGAAIEARVSRIVYGAPNPKAGALGGVTDVLRAEWTHRPRVLGGVRARECGALLTEFFAAVRR